MRGTGRKKGKEGECDYILIFFFLKLVKKPKTYQLTNTTQQPEQPNSAVQVNCLWFDLNCISG